MPKRILHSILANHKEASSPNKSTPQLQASGFNCNIDNLVAESPFTDDTISIEVSLPVILTDKYKIAEVRFQSLFQVFLSLRGPPAIG